MRIAAAAFEFQEGFIGTDAASNILRVNQSFIKLTGYLADGIETEAQRELLTSYGCPKFQGYLFGQTASGNHIQTAPVGQTGEKFVSTNAMDNVAG